MPVSGPNKDYAYKVAESVFTDIIQLLESRYNLTRPSEFLPLGEMFTKEWDKEQNKLLEVVKEMVWINHCSSW